MAKNTITHHNNLHDTCFYEQLSINGIIFYICNAFRYEAYH